MAGGADAELQRDAYALIVLDVGLPDGSGSELRKRLCRISAVLACSLPA
ncbi:MAG: hypothetical protein WBD29_16815 [Candidatus Competibacter sp.]